MLRCSSRWSRSWPFAALLLALAARPALAWDDVGHMVVARIAWMQLSPAARERLVAVLAQAPADAGLAQLRPAPGAADRDAMFASYASTWPDIVRLPDPAARHAYSRPPWHYIHWFWRDGADGRPEAVPGLEPDSVNILTELPRLVAVARDPRADAGQRAVALAWILHLMGDIAQPVHASSRVSARFPRGDDGALLFMLDSTLSLHWFWDRTLAERYPRAAGETDAAYVRRIADAVMRGAPRTYTAEQLDAGGYERWARHSLAVAQREVYCCGIAEDHPAPPGYLAHADQVVEPAVALAGARLAELLTSILGS